MATPEMPPEHHEATQALEKFCLALIAAKATQQESIPLAVCLEAWDSIAFHFEKWQQLLEEWRQIERLAATRIDELRSEQFFSSTSTSGTA